MTSKLYKIAKFGTAGLGIIGIILLVRVITAGDAVVEDAVTQASVVDPFITFTFIMLGLTTVITVVFSLFSLVQNPAALKKALITLVVMGVLLVLAYVSANDHEITNKFGQVIDLGEAGPISKNTGALIKYTYFLGAIGLACVLWGAVKDMLSK